MPAKTLRLCALATFAGLTAFPALAQDGLTRPSVTRGQLPTNDDPTRLVLKYAKFDPLREHPPVPAALAADADVGLWVVQFHGQPSEATRAAVRATGAELHGYLPHCAYVVRMDSQAAAAVSALPATRFVGAYQPAWRLDGQLLTEIAAGLQLPERDYNVVVVDKRRDKPALARAIAAIGGSVTDPQEGGLLMVVRLDGDELVRAARLDQVLWIDPWSAPEEDMNNARIQGGGDYVETMSGWTGQGVRGHVYEGVESNHQDFTTPFTNVLSGGGADTHGHCTAGIVFGNGTSHPNARGMAPDARGFYTQYSSVTAGYSRNAVLGQVVNTHQCMFTTASWGDARTRSYTSISADTDDIIFDHRIAWTQSQSNSGNQDSRPQAWAKNIFSIGAVDHFNNSNPGDDSWAAGGGSTGPAADGRIKPDLCAYYDWILCSDRTGSAGYSSGNYYDNFGGTSGATPICAGHNAIAIQMYTDGIFGNTLPVPSGSRFQNRPLAQTLKALQIANAQQYAFTASSTDNRREHVGWGFPSLRNMYDNRNLTYIVAEDDVLTPGIGRLHYLTVAPSTAELKVCMTFVDPAGNPAAALARVNDLTLRVTAPGGTVYWGNHGLTQGNYSLPGGTANTIDTVENVFVQSPAAGTWTVEVIATLIAQDAHVATAQVDATYALCCTGGTGVMGGTNIYAATSTYGVGCGGAATPSVQQTFYEQFDATNGFDLANSALRFVPNTSGGWDVTPSASGFIGGYSGALGLGDDQLSRNHALGFAFPLPGGGTTTAIDVDSNGWVGLIPGQHSGTDYTESVAELLGDPRRIAVCWDDLNPGSAGDVYFDALPGVAVVTWDGVPEYSNTGSNTAQLQLFPNGEFVLAYQAMSIADCLVGHSVGGGVGDPGPSDLTNPSNVILLTLEASGLPSFGSTVPLRTTNYPASAVLGVQVLSLVQFDPGISLAPHGMPGCYQYLSLDVATFLTLANGQSTYPLAIVNNTAFLGLPIFTQTYAFAPGINSRGVLSSNGIELIVGS